MWILDRASGESLFAYDEVAVPPTPANAAFQQPWPTQPQSSIESLTQHRAVVPAGYTAPPLWTPIGPNLMVFQPLNNGGMEWPPAAYSPRTHFVYSHANNQGSYVAVANADAAAVDVGNFFSLYESGAFKFLASPGVAHGVYGAVNTVTGQVAWTVPVLTSQPNSGVAVAGDLVFFGDSTGLFYAASAATGEILWVFDAATVPGAGGANGSPAVYEANGVEYVVYGFGGNPGTSFELGDAVIAFALPSSTAAAAAKAKAK